MAVASTPLRLYATTGRGQRRPMVATKQLDRNQVKNLTENPGLRKRLSQAMHIEEVTDHPILDLLDYVNPWMDRFQLIELTQLYMETVGPAYWTFAYQRRGGKRLPAEIWPLPAWQVYPVPDVLEGKVILEYIFTAGGGQTVIPIDEVLYFKRLNLFSPYDQTFSPLRAAYEMADIYDKRNDYEDSVLTNRARPDAILQLEDPGATASPEEIQRVNLEFYQNFGLSGAGRVTMLPGGYKYVPINYTPRDMDVPVKQKCTLHEIARSFDIPIPMLDVENANRAILDAALIQHARFGVRPRCRRMEELLNSNFVAAYDPRLFLAFDDPTPADIVLERETDRVYFQIGCRTPNEIRAKQGLPPLPQGDEAYLPANMVPMSIALDRAMQTIRASEPAPNPDEVPWNAHEPGKFPEEPARPDPNATPSPAADDGEYSGEEPSDSADGGTKAFGSDRVDDEELAVRILRHVGKELGLSHRNGHVSVNR